MITNTLNSGPFWVEDIPAAPVEVWFDNELEGFTHITAKLNGVIFASVPVHADVAEPYVFPWPADPFPTEGLYELALSAVAWSSPAPDESDVITARIRIGTWGIIVMEDDGWHTLDSARTDWVDAPSVDSFLYSLLAVAKHQCVQEAPALAVGAPVPDHYRLGQLLQAKALWQSALSDQGDDLNDGNYSVTLYPMDKTIKNVLRPRRGVPMILGAPFGNN